MCLGHMEQKQRKGGDMCLFCRHQNTRKAPVASGLYPFLTEVALWIYKPLPQTRTQSIFMLRPLDLDPTMLFPFNDQLLGKTRPQNFLVHVIAMTKLLSKSSFTFVYHLSICLSVCLSANYVPIYLPICPYN